MDMSERVLRVPTYMSNRLEGSADIREMKSIFLITIPQFMHANWTGCVLGTRNSEGSGRNGLGAFNGIAKRRASSRVRVVLRYLWNERVVKNKISGLKPHWQLHDLRESYDPSLQDIHAHPARQGELAVYIDDLVNEVKRRQEARESLDREFDDAEKTNEFELRHATSTRRQRLCAAPLTTSPVHNPISQHESGLEAVQNVHRDCKAVGG
ncbi:hypothetical protein M405DRAFT_862524 [Rhizopogon salebrosus TDB-379]|nr:hypothetical protein M405DRAFT_862524 [Rhizopogon salebrosus TDB-379]